MSLSDTAVRSAKPKERPYKLGDEKGLFLLVRPNGSKWWRFKYRNGGKEQLLSFGTYPDIGLKDARHRRDEARRLLAQGINPSHHRQIEKARSVERAANSFEAVAIEWLAKYAIQWTEGHADKINRRLVRDVFPWLGGRPISEIEPPAILSVLRRIEGRGAIETAHRAMQNCGQIFRYAIATGRAERDPSADLKGALPPVKQSHHASITDPKQIGELLRAIQNYQGSFVTQSALRLAPLVFVRPGELRHAEWDEFDLDRAEWKIPAGKMKARQTHIVPLSAQAIVILSELKPVTGGGQYLFPSVRTSNRPMSENTVLAALRRLGYSGEQMTGHGFRSMASTLLHEQGWPHIAIERQLAHGERNKVSAAYNYAEYLQERRQMMQSWADYLESLRERSDVVAG